MPQNIRSREKREVLEIVERDGKHYYRDRRTGDLELLNEALTYDWAGPANETQLVFDREDVRRLVKAVPAEEILAKGRYDHVQAVADAFEGTKFLTGGVTGTFWQCTGLVGVINLMALLYDAPDLIEYLSARLLERTVEQIRAMSAAGYDAIWIDDALSTCEMISVEFYERFSMPYVRAMVDEIHALGKVAVAVYFGGVADRVAQITSLGADSLNVETSMKGYVNDLGVIADQLGDRMCLWGNIDPLGVVEKGTDAALRLAIEEQVAIGRRTGRFILSTGSPITPGTPVERIRRFIELGWEASANQPCS